MLSPWTTWKRRRGGAAPVGRAGGGAGRRLAAAVCGGARFARTTAAGVRRHAPVQSQGADSQPGAVWPGPGGAGAGAAPGAAPGGVGQTVSLPMKYCLLEVMPGANPGLAFPGLPEFLPTPLLLNAPHR